MSKRNLQIDQTFDKFLAEHVVKNGRMSFCISIRGSQAVISGEQEIVALAEENLETITLKDIVENMKRIEKHDTVKHFKTSQKVDFPPMEVKFKGQLWTTKKARMQLSTYLNILGFGSLRKQAMNLLDGHKSIVLKPLLILHMLHLMLQMISLRVL